jgi:hypothetical protein
MLCSSHYAPTRLPSLDELLAHAAADREFARADGFADTVLSAMHRQNDDAVFASTSAEFDAALLDAVLNLAFRNHRLRKGLLFAPSLPPLLSRRNAALFASKTQLRDCLSAEALVSLAEIRRFASVPLIASCAASGFDKLSCADIGAAFDEQLRARLAAPPGASSRGATEEDQDAPERKSRTAADVGGTAVPRFDKERDGIPVVRAAVRLLACLTQPLVPGDQEMLHVVRAKLLRHVEVIVELCPPRTALEPKVALDLVCVLGATKNRGCPDLARRAFQCSGLYLEERVLAHVKAGSGADGGTMRETRQCIDALKACVTLWQFRSGFFNMLLRRLTQLAPHFSAKQLTDVCLCICLMNERDPRTRRRADMDTGASGNASGADFGRDLRAFVAAIERRSKRVQLAPGQAKMVVVAMTRSGMKTGSGVLTAISPAS